MKKPLPRKSAGFALVEVLVAVLIILLGIVGAVSVQGRGISAITDASGRAEVCVAAEELIGMMWNDQNNLASYAWNGSGTSPAAYADWYADLTTRRIPGTQVSVAISPIGTGTGRQVDLTFTWQIPTANAQRRYAVTTFITPP